MPTAQLDRASQKSQDWGEGGPGARFCPFASPLPRFPRGKYGKVRFLVSGLKDSLCCGGKGASWIKKPMGPLPASPAEDCLRLPPTELGLDMGPCRLCQVHCGAKDWRLHSSRNS